MNSENKPTENTPPYTGKTYAYIGAGLCVAAALFIGLTFTPLGVYSLIASVISGIASLAFLNVQKKKNNFKNLLIIRIIAYVVLGVSAALFIGGIIWSATNG